MKKKILVITCAVLGLLLAAAGTIYYLYGRDHYDPKKYRTEISDGLAVGSTIDFELPDQFDVPHPMSPEVRILVVSWGRQSSRIARDYFDKQPAELLAERSAMFVADISTAPTIIRNRAILPGLKKKAYPIVLIYEAEVAAKLTNKNKPDAIAIVALENKVVRRVSYATTEAELAAALAGRH